MTPTTPTPTTGPLARRAVLLVTAGLWLVVLAVYGQVVGHPWAAFDDPRFILTNPQIVAPADAALADLLLQPHIGYIVPVTGLTEAALWALGGGAPWPFHLAGLLLHGLVVTLLFGLARRLGGSLPAAALGALLFALHPVVVEPVAWATGLKDLLMASCALAATSLLVRSVQDGDAHPHTRRRLAGAALLAIAAVLAKPTGAFLAAAWLAWLAARSLRDHGRLLPPEGIARRAARLALAVALLAALVTFASWFMHSALIVEEDADLSGSFQPLLALGHHLALLAWPADLVPRYPIHRDAGFDDPMTTVGLVALVALAALAWAARRRPTLALGLGLAVAAWIPVSSLVPFPRMVADSYLYLPLAGLVLAATPPLGRLLATPRRHLAAATAAALVALAAALGVRAHDQAARWTSPVELWYPVAAAHDDWAFAWMQIGDGLRFAGEREHALRTFEQLFARKYVAEYLNKVALTLVELEQLDDAECVMVEELHYGLNRAQALNNHAVLLVVHPARAPRYPGHARQTLLWAAHGLEQGTLDWPPKLRHGLGSRLQQLPAWPEAPEAPWPLRSCPALRAPLRPGPPQ